MQNYNAFGLISVSPEKITATVTMVRDNEPITRSVISELRHPPTGFESSSGAATFGAWLEKGKKPVVSVCEVGRRQGRPAIGKIPEVGKVLMEAIDQASLALG